MYLPTTGFKPCPSGHIKHIRAHQGTSEVVEDNPTYRYILTKFAQFLTLQCIKIMTIKISKTALARSIEDN